MMLSNFKEDIKNHETNCLVKQPNGNPENEGEAVKFDWVGKWLKGDEYYHILTHAELYIKTYHFEKYPPKTHPPSTYSDPISIFNQ